VKRRVIEDGHHGPRLCPLDILMLGDIFTEYFSKWEAYIDMKTFFYSLLVPIISFALSTVHAAEPGNVKIGFVRPERFTDFRIQGRNETESTKIFRDQISPALSSVVAKRFPGATLSLTFTDINLAGRYVPSRTRNFNNVRFDREGASPLRLEFQYALTDSKGRVLTAGSKSLVESDYLRRYINYPNSDKVSTLFYEKTTLTRWLADLTPSSSTLAGK
jgi:Protein of unknown function (DUF3016)